MNKRPSDPVEQVIYDALLEGGWNFTNDPEETAGLDFKLNRPDFPVYIECKRFYAPRVAVQLGRANDIIVVQGIEAAFLFARMLTK